MSTLVRRYAYVTEASNVRTQVSETRHQNVTLVAEDPKQLTLTMTMKMTMKTTMTITTVMNLIMMLTTVTMDSKYNCVFVQQLDRRRMSIRYIGAYAYMHKCLITAYGELQSTLTELATEYTHTRIRAHG